MRSGRSGANNGSMTIIKETSRCCCVLASPPDALAL